jgi:hypothetical protein
VATPTRNTVLGNSLVNNAINNTTGNGPTQGYQSGISDQGDLDVIANIDICGTGYTPPGCASAALFAIDTTLTNNPKLKNNTICSDSSWWPWPFSAQAMAKVKAVAHHRRPPRIR